jgi:hypothetical protein
MSNMGLKAYLPVLGRIVDQMPISLYERQKSLAAEGLLHLVPGRGPGSGVRATPEAVATMVCSLLTSTGLTGDLGPRTRCIAETVLMRPPPGPDQPPYVPADGTRFLDVLVRVLSDEALAALIHEIEVDAALRYAVIRFPNTLPIVFTDRNRTASVPPIRTRNAIDKDTIRALAAAVKDMTASNRGEK